MLWQFMHDDIAIELPAKEIAADKNVWQALEFFNLNNEETIIVKNNEAAKKINYASLMHAFNKYKKAN